MSTAKVSRELAAKLRDAAHKFGEDSEAVLSEICEAKSTTGRLLAKMLAADLREARRGRKPDPARSHDIVATVLRLEKDGLPRSEALKKAPALLAKQGIVGPRGGAISVDSVRRACRDRAAYYWFAPVDD